MNFETMHQAEIVLMQFLAKIRSPMLDQFMLYMNWFDSFSFIYILIAVTWYAYDRKQGIRLLFLIVINVVFNQSMKQLFHQPRPFMFAQELGLITSNTFGFPSGAAQAYFVALGYLAYTVKKCWFSTVALVFLLLIGYSRVYLGMHFISDVVGAYILGGLLLYTYVRLEPSFEAAILKKTKKAQFCIVFVIAALLSVISLLSSELSTVLLGLGAAVGILLSNAPPLPRNIFLKMVWSAVAIGGYYLIENLPDGLYRSLLVGFWLSFGTTYFLIKTRKIQKRI